MARQAAHVQYRVQASASPPSPPVRGPTAVLPLVPIDGAGRPTGPMAPGRVRRPTTTVTRNSAHTPFVSLLGRRPRGVGVTDRPARRGGEPSSARRGHGVRHVRPVRRDRSRRLPSRRIRAVPLSRPVCEEVTGSGSTWWVCRPAVPSVAASSGHVDRAATGPRDRCRRHRSGRSRGFRRYGRGPRTSSSPSRRPERAGAVPVVRRRRWAGARLRGPDPHGSRTPRPSSRRPAAPARTAPSRTGVAVP